MSRGIAVVFAEDLYECLELHYPRLRLIEAGYSVSVVAPMAQHTYKSKEGYWAHSTCTVEEIDPQAVEIAVVPGGFCTDRLRRYPQICQFLRDCWAEGRGASVGFICHGGWLPISAGIVRGMKGTCFFAIKDDLVNAGMTYIDQPCVVDGRMVTARTPEDLPRFMSALLSLPAREKSQ
jgi:protease I